MMKKWFIAAYVVLIMTLALPKLVAFGSDPLVSTDVDTLWWAMSIGGVFHPAICIIAPFENAGSRIVTAIGTGIYLVLVAFNLWPIGILAIDPRWGKNGEFWFFTCVWFLWVVICAFRLSAAMHI